MAKMDFLLAAFVLFGTVVVTYGSIRADQGIEKEFGGVCDAPLGLLLNILNWSATVGVWGFFGYLVSFGVSKINTIDLPIPQFDVILTLFILVSTFGLTYLNIRVGIWITNLEDGTYWDGGGEFFWFVAQCVNWLFTGSAWAFIIILVGLGFSS